LAQLGDDLGISALTYLPTPDGLDNQYGEPWGHCVITEINRTSYDTDQNAKIRIKEWALGVSALVNSNDILGPFAQPTERDPYRPI
jgi:hypothetical protein